MLSKKERLTRALFDRSFSIGKRYHCPSVQLIVNHSDTFHGSVVVGKKVYKKAVDRNRLRRRLYAVLYQWNKERKSTGGTFILIAKPAIVKLHKAEYIADLRQLLAKLSEV